MSVSKKILNLINMKINDEIVKMLNHYAEKYNLDKTILTVEPFKLKSTREQRGGLNTSNNFQENQLTDLENWMSPAVQMVSFRASR